MLKLVESNSEVSNSVEVKLTIGTTREEVAYKGRNRDFIRNTSTERESYYERNYQKLMKPQDVVPILDSIVKNLYVPEERFYYPTSRAHDAPILPNEEAISAGHKMIDQLKLWINDYSTDKWDDPISHELSLHPYPNKDIELVMRLYITPCN